MKKKNKRMLISAGREDLLKTLEITQSGHAGCDRNGNIVDRRDNPDAVPVQKNEMFGVPEPAGKTSLLPFEYAVEIRYGDETITERIQADGLEDLRAKLKQKAHEGNFADTITCVTDAGGVDIELVGYDEGDLTPIFEGVDQYCTWKDGCYTLGECPPVDKDTLIEEILEYDQADVNKAYEMVTGSDDLQFMNDSAIKNTLVGLTVDQLNDIYFKLEYEM